MTQKTAPEKLVSALLQTIDPKEIADQQIRQTVELLLNLIEQLNLKVIELEADLGIVMSAGYLSNLLIKNLGEFETECKEVYREGLATSPWQHLDQTGARVGGVNYTTNIICNPLYTVYRTTRNKDRLSVLRVLQNAQELELILNELTYKLLGQFKLPLKWQQQLKLLPQETVFTETQFNALVEQHLEKLSSGYRSRIQEAAAIAFYHHKKLNPLVAYHQQLLDKFLKAFWDYYRELLAYREAPRPQAAEKLRAEFYQLFDSNSGYQQLDERKQLTAAKISELLLVLDHPELPLHNRSRRVRCQDNGAAA